MTLRILFKCIGILLLLSGCKESLDINKIPITTNAEAAKRLFLEARTLENLRKTDSANIVLDKAITLDTTFAMAYLMKGMISGDFNNRRAQIAKAMKYLPKVSEGEKLWIMGRNAFYGTGNSSEEYDLFKQLVHLYPEDQYANYLFGFVNLHHGKSDFDQAIEYIQKAIQIKPDFTIAYNELAYAYLEKEEFEKAKEASSNYIKLLPNLPDPYDTQAEILMREGSYQESINAYNKVLQIDPSYAWSIIGTAANLNYLDRHIEARKFLTKLDDIKEMSDYNFRHRWRAEVVSYLDEGKVDSALVVLENQKQMGIKKTTTHEPLFHAYYGFLRKTRLYFEKEDWKNGLKEYEEWNEFVQKNSTQQSTKVRLQKLKDYYEAYVHFLQKDFDQANSSLQKYVTAVEKENDQYLILKAKMQYAQGNNKAALDAIKNTDLTDYYNQFMYASILEALDKKEEAKKWFNKIQNANQIDDISLALVRKKIPFTQNPLEKLSYYIGTWGPNLDQPMVKRNPKMKDYKVIDFSWGSNKKVIISRTGINSNQGGKISSEGIITYNPNTKKIVWLEYQIDNEILFEGEYTILDNNKVQRVYTVYYAEDYPDIPNPQLPGWTRKYRETFTPISDNTIDWLTETLIDGKWVKQGQNNGDFKAIRDL